MQTRVLSCTVQGIAGLLVRVEVDTGPGTPQFSIGGLPEAAVPEVRARLRAAIQNSGLVWPTQRVMASLSPTDLTKDGSCALPLAIAVVLAADERAPVLDGALVVGELTLDGAVSHVNGVLPMVTAAQHQGLGQVYVPAADAAEAALVEGVDVYPVSTLRALVDHLRGVAPLARFEPRPPTVTPLADPVDMAHIKGQEHVKRALEVCAAGAHHILLMGPPGAGKTLLARALPSILPPQAGAEALATTAVYSVSGLLPTGAPLIGHRPFRAPHSSISLVGLAGGGHRPRPGEVSLAHGGVLFLDDLTSFGSRTLDVLRQPLEDRIITISRALGSCTFPADFILVGAYNPCPCGYYGDPTHECTCSAAMVTHYRQGLPGPLVDRIDLHVEVPRVEYEKLADSRRGEDSAAIRSRVAEARERQRVRFHQAGLSISTNAAMGPAEVHRFCQIDEAGHALLRAAMRQLALTARGYHRILKVARTIADLAGSERLQVSHIAEAVQYRPRSGL